MLKADQIELAILSILVDWSDAAGWSFPLNQLESMVAVRVGPISPGEVVDALILLHENSFVAIDQYRGSGFVPYDPAESSQYFYGPPFRCKALPRARRRQQELSKGSRHGIFISHIGEERPIALHLQHLLEEALSPQLPIFVSSDYKSIESGEPWYAAILAGLRKSQAIISLLSPASLDRRWINFETGVGLGQDSRVIPVAWRGLSKGDIGNPLGHLQARDLHDEADLRALLRTLANICGTSCNETPVTDFVQDLPQIEADMPHSELAVRVFRQGSALGLAIENLGNRPLDMVEAELLIPEKLRGNLAFHDYSPVRMVRRHSENGMKFIGFYLTTTGSQVLHLGVNPLRPVLAPGTGEQIVEGLGFSLPYDLTTEDEALPVRYMVCTRQFTVGPFLQPIAEIQRRG